MVHTSNPFGLTKANDLTDAQILNLWVDVEDLEGSKSLLSLARPSSPMPMFILGGKGSGKTHLMRYCSYPLQKLRFERAGTSLSQGITDDGYIGVYVPFAGLRPGRFSGKQQPDTAWTVLFSYYVELWLARAMIEVLGELVLDSGEPGAERQICSQIRTLFDADPPSAENLRDLAADLQARHAELDYIINNVAFEGVLKPRICVTRGRLIFGLPKIAAGAIPALMNCTFAYQLDQFEDLSTAQQRYINTLVREREAPATFKIGGRSFGIKTLSTDSDDEENLRDSEFEELRLDEQFRGDKGRYKRLAKLLLQSRLSQSPELASPGQKFDELDSYFEQPDLSWRSDYFNSLFPPEQPRAHLDALRSKLERGTAARTAPGVHNNEDIDWVLSQVAVERYPLLERLNVLLVYQAWSDQLALPEAASRIKSSSAAFAAGQTEKRYAEKLSHYKTDIIAQMMRENGLPQPYAGINTFIDMSEGQPRALLTLLKQIYDWSEFQGESPFIRGMISLSAQRKGALAAADWFYNSMTKAGRDGGDIIICVDRLAQLFRINRFSDNPTECSLIGFSASLREASDRAQAIIRLAKERSFLVEISGGQSERNSERVTTKLQLNRMLVPRWRLPTGRRGIAPFDSTELNSIFDPDNAEGFEKLRLSWETRGQAPAFKRTKTRDRSIDDATLSVVQPELFSKS